MIVTTTHSVDGKSVKKYLGLVSGADLYGAAGLLGGGYTSGGQTMYFQGAIAKAKEQMIKAAAGADAIIGVQTVIGASAVVNDVIVTLTGTAVMLEDAEEKYNDELPEL